MDEHRNQSQIIRKDAQNCFVESLSDAFDIGRFHLAFATYDLHLPPGKRQTNNVHIYIEIDRFLELHRKLTCGELRYILQNKKQSNDKTPIFQYLGGTSAENLQKQGRSRNDGMSLSRTAQLIYGAKTDFLFIADSGPGQKNEKGLIVPRFGNRPENHVVVSMSFDDFSGFMLVTEMHYRAWLTSQYLSENRQKLVGHDPKKATTIQSIETRSIPSEFTPMF